MLSIDTATTVLSIAVLRGEASALTCLARADLGPPGPSNSMLLPSAIDPVLAAAGVTQAALTGLVVGLGPGAFTGLRVSLATLKGISFARRLPLVGASSLQALALAGARLVPEAASIVPLLDARKGQVYAGLFRREGAGVVPAAAEHELAVGPAELLTLLAGLPAPLLVFGEGFLRFRELLELGTEGRRVAHREGLPLTPPAPELAELAAHLLGPYDAAASAGLEPNYVRPSEAEARLIAATGAPVL